MCDYVDYVYLADYYEFASNLWWTMKVYEMTFAIFCYFRALQNTCLLNTKCVEIYDNNADELKLKLETGNLTTLLVLEY